MIDTVFGVYDFDDLDSLYATRAGATKRVNELIIKAHLEMPDWELDQLIRRITVERMTVKS